LLGKNILGSGIPKVSSLYMISGFRSFSESSSEIGLELYGI
jgi:hypothetical protein